MSDVQDTVDETPTMTAAVVVQSAVEGGLITASEGDAILRQVDTPTEAVTAVSQASNRPSSEVRATVERVAQQPVDTNVDPDILRRGGTGTESEPIDRGPMWRSFGGGMFASSLGPVGQLTDTLIRAIGEIDPNYAESREDLYDVVRDAAMSIYQNRADALRPVMEDARFESEFAREAADALGIPRHQFIGYVSMDGIEGTKQNLINALVESGQMDETDARIFVEDIERSTALRVESVQATEAEVDEQTAAQIGNYTDEERTRLREFLALEEARPGAYYWDHTNRVARVRTGVDMGTGEDLGGFVIDGEGNVDFESPLNDPELIGALEPPPVAPWYEQGIGESSWREVEMIQREGGTRGDRTLLRVDIDPETNIGTAVWDDTRLQIEDRDAARFATGQPDFLGNIPSTYKAKIDQQRAMSRLYGGYLLPPGYDLDDLTTRLTDADLMQLDQIYATGARPIYEAYDEVSQFVGMSDEFKADHNQLLIDVGLLTLEDLNGDLSQWNSQVSGEAMHTLMFEANLYGDTIYSTQVQNAVKQATKATQGPKLPAYVPAAYRPLDEATLTQSVKQLLRNNLRRNPTDNEIAQLGDYLAEQHREAFVADEQASRAEYDARLAATQSGSQYAAAPGAIADVDYEARFLENFEKQFAQNLSFEREGRQANEMMENVGGAMDNFMRRLGGGIG